MVFLQDAVYIDLGGSKAGQRAAAAAAAAAGKKPEGLIEDEEPENELISSLHSTQTFIDSKMEASELSIFKVRYFLFFR